MIYIIIFLYLMGYILAYKELTFKYEEQYADDKLKFSPAVLAILWFLWVLMFAIRDFVKSR